MTEILCHGNELNRVCLEIKAKGGQIEAMDAMVGGKPAQYRLEVFYGSVPELAPPSPSGKALTGEYCQQVNNPATPTPPESVLSPPLPPCPSCGGPLLPAQPCPICAAMDRIHAHTQEQKRLRQARKPTEARLPHAD